MNGARRRVGGSLLAGAMLCTAMAGVGAHPPTSAMASLQSPALPTVTLLYQNFPNPFPTSGTAITCIWFDLHRASRVRLTVHDLRGTLVRSIIPSSYLSSNLPAGRFGRGNPDANSGCDQRFSWDGADEKGRTVPPGVYIVRLKAEHFEGVKKIVFRGR